MPGRRKHRGLWILAWFLALFIFNVVSHWSQNADKSGLYVFVEALQQLTTPEMLALSAVVVYAILSIGKTKQAAPNLPVKGITYTKSEIEEFKRQGPSADAGSHLAAKPEEQRGAAKPQPQSTVTPVPKTIVPASVPDTVAAKAVPETARPSRRKWLVLGSIVFLIVATAGGFWYWSRLGLRTAQRQVESPPAITLSPKEQVESPPAITFSPFALERTLSGDRGSVDTVAFSPDGKLLASGSELLNSGYMRIQLWDVASGTLRQTLAGHNGNSLYLGAAAFSPDGRLLASCSGDNMIRLWDVASGALRQTLSGQHGSVLSVAFSPDGKVLASGSTNPIVKLWDVTSGAVKQTLTLSTGEPKQAIVGREVPVAFSPDGRLLAVSPADNKVEFLEMPTGNPRRTLTGQTNGAITVVAFSPDGKVLASAGDDGTVKLWDVASGAVKQTLTGHDSEVNSVAFGPDGLLLASGSGDKTIKLWDVASGNLRQTLTGHDGMVFSVAFSPDGKLLASGSMDKTIKLWRRGENAIGSTGRETSVEATVSQTVRTPGEVRENAKDGLKYVWIPPGTFMMGCSPGDTECNDDEKPPHQVTITKGFWLGQTEVTVGAYKRFVAATGKAMPDAPGFNPGWSNEQMPIVNASWDDANTYCGWARGRLPTEAEWEYAARGGSSEARYGSLDEVAWYASNSGSQLHLVGQKRANCFGLYDMLGNVWEWVNDWYDQNYYQNSPAQDPTGATNRIWRVLRGGSWVDYRRSVRVSIRVRVVPFYWSNYLGFRCGGEVADP
jgi:WD40 repeat protein